MSIVQTVLGIIDPKLLGHTLTHEHVGLDFGGFYCYPPEEFKTYLEQGISMANLGYIRQYPYSSRENSCFYDEETREAVVEDIKMFKKFGGGSIVDNSSHGLQRNLKFMVDASKRAGVHLIAGTGHYMDDVQDEDHKNMTLEQMTNLYSEEIINGVSVERIGRVKCGFIGAVGSVYPIRDFEKRAIKATGEIQAALGCGVSFHPGLDAQAPFEILRLYLEAGGRADKCVMAHLDRTIFDLDELLEFSKLGCYLQYDLFGTECSYYQLNPTVDMPSDAQRVNNLMKLIEEGLVSRILMSHDIHTKHRLTTYGGHGYHHLHMNVLPRMFEKGLSIEQAEQITVTNPAEWLQFNIKY